MIDGMNSYILMIAFFVLFPCGFLSAALAASKNQKYWTWLIAGLLFGPLGLIGSVCAKDKSNQMNIN